MGITDTERGGLLLLEDDRGVCELEAQRLEPLGLPIRRAYSAEEARALLAAGPSPELLLIDYSLPDQNALQFIDGLRAAGTEIPPFVVVTGRGDEAVAVAAMKAGACDYLVKNAGFLDNLLPVVRKALEHVELRRQLEAARASTARNLHLYTFLAQVNLAAARTRDRGDLYRKICDIAVSAGLRMAWIGVPDRDLGRITPFCWSGAVDGYLDGIRLYLGGDSPESRGPAGAAAATKKICPCADIARDPAMAPWRGKALERGYRSLAAIPLEEGGRLAAVLNLYSDETGFFTSDELKLLEEIRADIALALEAISAEERRAAAQAALERTAADLAHIMDVTPVMLFRLRFTGSGAPALEWVSGNIEALTGYTPEEALRPGWAGENTHPEDRAGADNIAEILPGKTLLRDFRFRRKGGDYFWVHEQLKLSREGAGEVTGSWTDITPLKESEARFHDLFEKAPLGYQSLDEEGRFLEVNQAWLDTLGYGRAEVTGKWFGDFVAPEYREAFRERFPRFKAAGKIHSEFEMLRKNGERRFIAFDGRIARTPSGEFQRTHCILRDISDAKLAEARLKSSEARFRTLFECGNDAMFLYPYSADLAAMKFVEVNHVACERLGYSREELLRLGPVDIGAEGTAAARADALRRLAADGRAVFEMTHRAKDGRLIPVEVSAGRFDYDGRPYVMAVARDLTERRRAEAERSLLSEAVKASLNEVYIFDDGTLRFKFVNQGALANLGYSLGEMAALTPLDLKPEVSKEEFAALIAPLREGRVTVSTFVTRHRRKDGSLYPVEVHLQHVPGNGVFLAIVNDVTERQKAEAALKQQTDLLRLAGRAARFGGWRVEKGADRALWTDETAMLHDMPAGYSPTVGEAINYYAPESRPAITEAVRACLEEGRPFDLELQMVSAKGRKFWARAIGQAERNAAGEITSIFGSFQDIDERKKLDLQLAEQQRRYREIFEITNVAKTITLPDGTIKPNKAFCDLLGYTAAELAALTWKELTPAADSQRVLAVLADLASGKIDQTRHEKAYLRKDGAVVWGDVSITVKRDRTGRVEYFLTAIADITARKAAEKERERLSTAIDQAGEAVVITDSKGTIVYVNPAFERVTGYGRAEALGKNPSILKSGRQDAAFYKEMWDSLRSGRQWSGRLVNRRRDGALFTEETVISPVKDELGHVVNYVAVKRDVTEQLALEDRLRQSQKMESLGLLAGGVAHDFNNLLTGITGYAGLLKKAMPRGDPKLQDLQEILYAAERASELTRQLLIFSRREVAKPVAMDINEGVRSALKLVGRVIGEDMNLVTRLAPAACVTRMDPGHFSQVLMNLAVNARDAMPGGGTLTIATADDQVPPGSGAGAEPMLLLEVADTGCGMTPELLSHIFEPFFTTKERGKGTGLGLPTIYSIITQAGGEVRAASEPGKGTTFSIYLPKARLAVSERPLPAVDMRPGAGRGELVLLVEDEERLRVLGQRMLEAGGYTVVAAAGGREALEKAAALGRPLDIVVSDLVLPGMNGRELAAELSRRGLASRFLYVSGYTDELISRHGVLEDGVAFLPKPFTPYSLTARLREVLDGPPEKAGP